MVSALGRTADGFAEIKRAVGQRAWSALYLGVPSSPDGGLIHREWLDQWRLPASPESPTMTVVGVDPSDSGSGDSCGLIAASRSRDGVVAVLRDISAPMTSDAWASAAVRLALDVGASEIAVEGFAARETYVRVVREALGRVDAPHPIKVTSWPPKGSGRGGGDSMARAAALVQGLEVGTVRLVGHHPALEEQAVAWQAGQHQPDALAALVVAHDVLVHAAGQWSIAAPVGVVADNSNPRVTSMAGYLARRTDGRHTGYDPLTGFAPVRRSR
jgi:phage terminase large subunit-like protein